MLVTSLEVPILHYLTLVTPSILIKDVDMDAEVTVVVKPLPIYPIQAILQDLKATIKDNLLETVLKPKEDDLGNKIIKQQTSRKFSKQKPSKPS
ncbi:unnamed protein product [Cylindrotheca closterium]|uniref:Uncharacterized protein n=1 Tax=Cylindrotheca closterium TaxID=2856 RepID=A0AAD2FTG1_9STRA|nr:unnamed protein product [Cylindrotheca closterium]